MIKIIKNEIVINHVVGIHCAMIASCIELQKQASMKNANERNLNKVDLEQKYCNEKEKYCVINL